MKTKLFALIMSILCLATLLVACDKECDAHVDENNDAVCDNCGEAIVTETESESETETETEGVCDHVDTDADKACDNCGKAIVAIVEQIPAETESAVDMIVNKIPENVDLSEFVSTKLPALSKITSAKKIAGYTYIDYVFVLTENVDEEGVKTQELYNIIEDKTLVTKTDVDTDTKKVTYTISLGDFWYIVEENEEVIDPDYVITGEEDEVIPMIFNKRVTSVYTYSGEQIGATHYYDGKDTLELFEEPTLDYTHLDVDQLYVNYADTVYAVSTDTYSIVYSGAEDTFVYRPDMDYVAGDYGYIIDMYVNDYTYETSYYGINVYDLKNWIKCVYTYEVPADAVNAKISVLNGGDILVTYNMPLPGKSVNYDYILDEVKYDMVYTVIDKDTFEEKNVEFGYYVSEVVSLEGYEGSFTEKATAYNIVFASDIIDGRIEYNKNNIFFVDNDLNIVCDATKMISMDLVADGVFVRYVEFNDQTDAYELVTIKGEHIGYLPTSCEIGDGYRRSNNKIYDYAGKLIIDLEKYTLYGDGTNDLYYYGFMIMSLDVEDAETETIKTVYSLFTIGGGSKTIDTSKTDWQLEYVNELGYVVSYTEERITEPETPEELPVSEIVTVYELYNNAGELVLKSDSYIDDSVDVYEGDVCVITNDAGEIFIIK